RAVGDRDGEAVTLSNMGMVYNDLGQRQKALDFTEQSLAIFRDIGNLGFEAGVLANLGEINLRWGDNRKAADYYSDIHLNATSV
ncbi:MAG TPA: tetratricopeptide repeat protein, partial [Pyrinomonadaceae bacterium]